MSKYQDEPLENFYEREFLEQPEPNYGDQEVIYHLEVLPLNRKSAIQA